MTLPSLTIEGFRAFRRLEVPRLARVNLIVGSNNVGKTSLLEALGLFVAGPQLPQVLATILQGRREFPTREPGDWDFPDLLRIFHGVSGAEPQRRLVITDGVRTLSMTRAWAVPNRDAEHFVGDYRGAFDIAHDIAPPHQQAIEVLDTRLNDMPPVLLPLDGERTTFPSGWHEQAKHVALTGFFIPSKGLDEESSAHSWDALVLQGEEDLLIELLRLIQADVERVFFVKVGDRARSAYVRRAGQRNAEPLYSLGGGMRRLLDLALGLVEARGGLLLVDEIENGIHYGVQPDLWALIFEAATRLDVQVFATTHSWDCIEAFQRAAAAHPATGELIRLHRSGTDIKATVADEADLAIITRQAIEVR